MNNKQIEENLNSMRMIVSEYKDKAQEVRRNGALSDLGIEQELSFLVASYNSRLATPKDKLLNIVQGFVNKLQAPSKFITSNDIAYQTKVRNALDMFRDGAIDYEQGKALIEQFKEDRAVIESIRKYLSNSNDEDAKTLYLSLPSKSERDRIIKGMNKVLVDLQEFELTVTLQTSEAIESYRLLQIDGWKEFFSRVSEDLTKID